MENDKDQTREEVLDFESEVVPEPPKHFEEVPPPEVEDIPPEPEDNSAPIEEIETSTEEVKTQRELSPEEEFDIVAAEFAKQHPDELVKELEAQSPEEQSETLAKAVAAINQEEQKPKEEDNVQTEPFPEHDLPPEKLDKASEVVDQAISKPPEDKVEVQPIELYFPNIYPLGGRVITIGVRMVEQKTKSGLYIVPKGITRDNFDRLRSNPNEDMMYFVVSMCPTVNHNLRTNGMLPKKFNQFIPLQIGDQIIVSPNMEPVYHREMTPDGLREFWIWHHSDLLGFRKDPGNMEDFEKQFGPKPKMTPVRNDNKK